MPGRCAGEMESDTVEDFTESLEPVRTCELGGYQVICDVEAARIPFTCWRRVAWMPMGPKTMRFARAPS